MSSVDTIQSKTASAVVTPAAPVHLSVAAKTQWTAKYATAHAQAKIDHPDNPGAQRTAALRSANTVLKVPEPKSAADIEVLEPWQVLLRSTRNVNGIQTLVCVTTDGRKYSFPISSPQPSVDLNAMSKWQLISHAFDVHGLELDSSLKKNEMIAAIAEKAAK